MAGKTQHGVPAGLLSHQSSHIRELPWSSAQTAGFAQDQVGVVLGHVVLILTSGYGASHINCTAIASEAHTLQH